MKHYTVGQLAKLSGVSKRTLHYYDEIKLLTPKATSHSGYRLYGSSELLRLQQILLFKNVGIPLNRIALLLKEGKQESVEILKEHKKLLMAKKRDCEIQMATIENTIQMLTEKKMSIRESELYKGLNEVDSSEIRREAFEKWGSEVEEVERKISAKSKKEWANITLEGESIAKELSEHLHFDAGSKEVQTLVNRQLKWLENFYPVPKERFIGLANMYVQDEKFRHFYDKHNEGTANLLYEGMLIFSDRHNWF